MIKIFHVFFLSSSLYLSLSSPKRHSGIVDTKWWNISVGILPHSSCKFSLNLTNFIICIFYFFFSKFTFSFEDSWGLQTVKNKWHSWKNMQFGRSAAWILLLLIFYYFYNILKYAIPSILSLSITVVVFFKHFNDFTIHLLTNWKFLTHLCFALSWIHF